MNKARNFNKHSHRSLQGNRESISKLRETMSGVDEARPISITVGQYFSSLVQDIAFVLFPPPAYNAMCKNYGHVIAPTHVNKANIPLCLDCGKAITDPNQLRKSALNGTA